MKKIIAGSIHILSVLLMLTGLAALSLHANGGSAFSFISQPDYCSSPDFEAEVSEAVTDIFDYVGLKELFETNGTLDLKQIIAQAEENGVSLSYSLDYLIKYARSMGYYLNEKNEIMDNGPRTVSPMQDERAHMIRVTYRAYMPDYQPSSPSDGIMSLGKLAQETLSYLAKYYAVRAAYLDHPGNLSFHLSYSRGSGSITYTNAPDRTAEEIGSMGRYLYTDSGSLQLRTNLNAPASNLVPLLEAGNPYPQGNYVFAVGIDTGFPQKDRFSEAASRYEADRINSIVGLVLFILSLLLACLSYAVLVRLTAPLAPSSSSALRASELRAAASSSVPRGTVLPAPLSAEGSPSLLFDRIAPDLLLLAFFLWLLWSNLLAPAFLSSVEAALGALPYRHFWENSLSFLLKYLFFLPVSLSLIRSYRAELLWKNTVLRRCLEILRHYIRSAALTAPRFFSYLLFLLPNAAGLLLIALLFLHFFRRQSLNAFFTAIALLLILLAIDLYIWQLAAGLTRAVNEQVRSERMKADLITNVSHDLKTPLTSIISYVDLIKRERIGNPRVQEYLEVLDQKSQRLKQLTEDLVEASKASSGNISIELSELDFSEMLLQALGEFEDRFAAGKLSIVESIPSQPVMILADGRHLWRVLENLLNNCCKYALRGSRVYVELQTESGFASCTIKNISEAPLNISPEELTERFVRGDASRTTEGSGLGLSIAKSLTTLMNGRLIIGIDGDLYKVSIQLPLLPKPPAA